MWHDIQLVVIGNTGGVAIHILAQNKQKHKVRSMQAKKTNHHLKLARVAIFCTVY